MKLYISGPMTGIDDYNRPAFAAEEMQLRAAGYEVFNPGAQPEGLTRAAYMRADIAGLLTCDGVAVLPGWDKSMGAKVEVAVAHEIGISVMSPAQWRFASRLAEVL